MARASRDSAGAWRKVERVSDWGAIRHCYEGEKLGPTGTNDSGAWLDVQSGVQLDVCFGSGVVRRLTLGARMTLSALSGNQLVPQLIDNQEFGFVVEVDGTPAWVELTAVRVRGDAFVRRRDRNGVE